jgi:hypothetical protein
LTLSLVALHPKAVPSTAEELAAWRSRWVEAIQAATGQGPGGVRGTFIPLAPPGLWEPLDRSFVHAVAADATFEEAQAIARRLTASGDSEDLWWRESSRSDIPSPPVCEALPHAH